MKILVINAGSSSLKYQLIDMDTETAIAKGNCERIGSKDSFLTHKAKGVETRIDKYLPDHTAALELVLNSLTDKNIGVIDSVKEINAVGHRVLHGGEDFKSSVLINDDVIKVCEKNTPLGPLHMPANMACIKSCQAVMPGVPMVAVFDTSFHSTMPQYAYMYAVSYDMYEKYAVRKYGFHGTSHKFVSSEAIKFTGKKDSKIITCHLGNGASIAAIKDGKVLDTSMGFTPLEGLVMGTRSGDVDPAIMEYIMDKTGMNIHEMLTYLNKKSGFAGLTGIGSDTRDVEKAASDGNTRAKLALDMFAYRVKKYIGSYAAVLNGVDTIVFTGGIGENSASCRERILTGLEYLGVKLDKNKNNNIERGKLQVISAEDSKVCLLVIPTNEELVIARDTEEIVSKL